MWNSGDFIFSVLAFGCLFCFSALRKKLVRRALFLGLWLSPRDDWASVTILTTVAYINRSLFYSQRSYPQVGNPELVTVVPRCPQCSWSFNPSVPSSLVCGFQLHFASWLKNGCSSFRLPQKSKNLLEISSIHPPPPQIHTLNWGMWLPITGKSSF